MLHKVISIIDGQPTFTRPLPKILAELKVGGALKTLDPLEYHTDQQRKWYKGPCLKGLSEWSGESKEWWDRQLKKKCHGLELLKKEVFLLDNGAPMGRLTITGVGKRNMTAFIEEILSYAIAEDLPVTPPDKELRA